MTVTLGNRTQALLEGTGQVFSGTFAPPIVGNTFIITVTADGQTEVANGTTLIDPDGYVYDEEVWERQGITQTIAGVHVTCYYSGTQWTVWPAWEYESQINPQVTGGDGYYAFFVSPGTYRVTASHPDYQPYTSADIVVVDTPVHLNIPLRPWRRVYLPLILRSY